jgi:hypothetical protein
LTTVVGSLELSFVELPSPGVETVAVLVTLGDAADATATLIVTDSD